VPTSWLTPPPPAPGTKTAGYTALATHPASYNNQYDAYHLQRWDNTAGAKVFGDADQQNHRLAATPRRAPKRPTSPAPNMTWSPFNRTRV
jgi:hypothetical protein